METDIKQNRITQITRLVKTLAPDQQKALEFQLQKMILTEKANFLEKTVARNSITIEEIVAEVKNVRHAKE